MCAKTEKTHFFTKNDLTNNSIQLNKKSEEFFLKKRKK